MLINTQITNVQHDIDANLSDDQYTFLQLWYGSVRDVSPKYLKTTPVELHVSMNSDLDDKEKDKDKRIFPVMAEVYLPSEGEDYTRTATAWNELYGLEYIVPSPYKVSSVFEFLYCYFVGVVCSFIVLLVLFSLLLFVNFIIRESTLLAHQAVVFFPMYKVIVAAQHENRQRSGLRSPSNPSKASTRTCSTSTCRTRAYLLQTL